MNKFLCVLIGACGLCLGNLSAWAQEVTGTVTDASDNTTLPGVNVVVKGTTIGTVTDIDGNYRIDAAGGSAVLVFSSVGYKAAEEPVNNRSTIDLALQTDVTALNEVVVTLLWH